MGTTITISGQKGGCGKSVFAVNISASLALFERKILLVDCDPQASATAWMPGIEPASKPDMASLFSGRAWIQDVIRPTQLPYLDMIPSGIDLFYAARKLSGGTDNQKILRLLLAEVAGEYDYILLDAPSSYEYLSIASLAASDWILGVMADREEFNDEFGRLLQLVRHIRNTHRLPLKLAGIVFNRCPDSRSSFDGFVTKHLADGIQDLVFRSFMPEHDSVKLTVTRRMPAALLDLKSLAAVRYMNITRELVSIFEQEM